MACVSLGQVISQEISKIGWKAEFQQLGAPCNTLMVQVFAYSTQPRELLDKQTSTELENTRSSLPAEAGTFGAVPQSKIKETSSAVYPPHSSHLNLPLHQGSASANWGLWQREVFGQQ